MTTPQQPYQAPNADDFLMGGGGAPSAAFPSIGTTVAGCITEKPTVEQQRDMSTGDKKFWNDGNPMMQLVVTVQTEQRDPSVEDDDGRRRIFVKGAMKNAIADAVRTAGAKGLEIGGTLTVTFTHELPPKQRGWSPPKQYAAQYVPAAQAELMAPVPGLTPQQAQAAQQNPATAALYQQQQAQQAAAAASPPPF
ncbi:hypothetical protein ABZ208_35495 [Streptomyces sp. NPDC006208]|uniref:hypothetical protein n=1 Tax=Streptomyces sp. NPDC006208 TaxID=3156734 RepID=UPI0033A53245